jgi:hypothetical protein
MWLSSAAAAAAAETATAAAVAAWLDLISVYVPFLTYHCYPKSVTRVYL